ncbi:type-F conjugative transfer system secretin TraK [Burkholderia glumae]|uniref:type-F conjugative transfer system secretin TraK n=1 Tax=Burkholderia glumae TaxID=337 RepID=UPI00214F7EBC|nr:type-F conjugative transfer system secretin TraK [Burkholderia glumae]
MLPLVAPLAALFVAAPASAISIVKGSDRQAQQVFVSAAEYNLLTMSGGRQITKVVPTVPGSLAWTQAGNQFWFKPSNPTVLISTES